ncbi:hypothetical protein B0H11DRAFT_1704636, partial [Mycena galericulata]
ADANVTDPSVAAVLKRTRTFRTFSYRGIVLEKPLNLSSEDCVEVGDPFGMYQVNVAAARPRSRSSPVPAWLEAPETTGSVVGIYNSKVFNNVEIKPEITGHYVGEFSYSYR